MAKLPKCTTSQAKKFKRCERQVIKTVKPRNCTVAAKNVCKKSASVAMCSKSIGCSLRAK